MKDSSYCMVLPQVLALDALAKNLLYYSCSLSQFLIKQILEADVSFASSTCEHIPIVFSSWNSLANKWSAILEPLLSSHQCHPVSVYSSLSTSALHQVTTLRAPLWGSHRQNHPEHLPESIRKQEGGSASVRGLYLLDISLHLTDEGFGWVWCFTFFQLWWEEIVIRNSLKTPFQRVAPKCFTVTQDQPPAVPPLLLLLRPRRYQTQLQRLQVFQVPGSWETWETIHGNKNVTCDKSMFGIVWWGLTPHAACTAIWRGPLAASDRANHIDHGHLIHRTTHCHWKG